MVIVDRDLADGPRDGDRQFPAGVQAPVQEVCDRLPGVRSRHPGFHHRRAVLFRPGEREAPRPVQHQHHRLSGLHDRFQQRLLLARKVQMAAVLPFPAGDMDPAAVAAHRHHDDIRSFRRFHRFGKALPAGGDDVAALRVPDSKPVFQLLPERPAADRPQDAGHILDLRLLLVAVKVDHAGKSAARRLFLLDFITRRGLFLGALIGHTADGHLLAGAGSINHLQVGGIGVPADRVAEAVGVGADDREGRPAGKREDPVVL